MKHKLKDARVVDIVPLSSKIPVRWFLEFINSFVEEDSYLLHNRRMNLREEREWLKNALRNVRKKEWAHIAAIHDKRVVGTCSARKGMGRESRNVMIGVAVSKDFRRAGLGEFLMKRTISEAKKKLNPKNIYLSVAAPNKPAKKLYEKLGFKEIARFPKWMEHRGKFHDTLWMILKK